MGGSDNSYRIQLSSLMTEHNSRKIHAIGIFSVDNSDCLTYRVQAVRDQIVVPSGLELLEIRTFEENRRTLI